MVVRKITTEAARDHIERYDNSNIFSLYQAYKKPSFTKEKAMEHCYRLFNEFDGRDLKIIGYNKQTFSVGFWGNINGRETFFYITSYHDMAYN